MENSISRLEDDGTVDIKATADKVRSQRAGSIMVRGQYVFCYLALIKYAELQHKLNPVDLSDFGEPTKNRFNV